MKSKIDVTLVVPCYNEMANIQKGVLDKIGNYTKDDNRFKEIIIVDDGSTDSTKPTIKTKYLTRFDKFSLIENEHQGKAFAVMTGIKNAKYDYVMFSDIDLATPIEESEKLIPFAENEYDVVIGSRPMQRDGAPILRQILARGFILIRNILIGLRGIKDTQCGFKLFETKAANKIIDELRVFKPKKDTVSGPSVSAGFDLEFLFVANALKYKIKEVPVIWRHVETKNVNFVHDAVETLKDIIKIKYYYMTRKYDF